jgi:pimeloyl-ACP methyl ester carboxylesterase
MRDGKQRLAQHRHLLFPGVCFRVCAYMRGGGVTWSRVTSLFWVIASLFSRPKFPVRLLRETSAEEAGIPRQPSNADAARARVSQISLYFSLLAGNLGRRLVRDRLRRQPASAVSRGCFLLARIRALLLGVSETQRSLCSSISRMFGHHRSISRASLRSPLFNIRFLAPETRFAARKLDREPEAKPQVGEAQLVALAKWGAIPATDRYGDLKKIKQRTLVVNGKDDIMVPTINSYILQQHLPDARLILYPD